MAEAPEPTTPTSSAIPPPDEEPSSSSPPTLVTSSSPPPSSPSAPAVSLAVGALNRQLADARGVLTKAAVFEAAAAVIAAVVAALLVAVVVMGIVPFSTPLRVLLGGMARLGRLRDGTGFVGTADELADLIERLGDEADNDGVLLWGDLHPVTVHRILDDLVPILRRRGVLRTEFGGGGLRANLRDF